jgi:hypothetical protein
MSTTMRLLVLTMVVGVALCYPGGAPHCGALPNHRGASKGETLALHVEELEGNYGVWNVTVPIGHKGLLLNSDTEGVWDEPRGYHLKNSCITHRSRKNKPAGSFLFRAVTDQQPTFTGVLVTAYSEDYRLLDSTATT